MKISLKKGSVFVLGILAISQLVSTAVQAWPALCYPNMPGWFYNKWYHITWYCANGTQGVSNQHNPVPTPTSGYFLSNGSVCLQSWTIQDDYDTQCAP